MTEPKPRRPWRKRKRTWAAVALWLAVLYPLSLGPALYAVNRRWVSVSYETAVWSAYKPLDAIDRWLYPGRKAGWGCPPLRWYADWWAAAGMDALHAARD